MTNNTPKKRKAPIDIDDPSNGDDIDNNNIDDLLSDDDDDHNDDTVDNDVSKRLKQDDATALTAMYDFDFDLEPVQPEMQLLSRINTIMAKSFDSATHKQTPPMLLMSILYQEIKDNTYVDKNIVGISG
ncbi:hypothetical protein SAMD00019534_028970 [Acytostelium subglobosum LB1]|uniref:hypothetical protein n=1 Tax=Acytostelium subglobosum LB1 TaxID=1410327 RepID=UPI000644D0BD|nr:hypothetical protein SAMD00019534_028970 [Acytostelium subglobosum LB1]GAM19722.1 hypothetical protein SAMD00019534_028970 [Acytostelium subglobosum LB1]|eukprot:XP_012756484.1 hypothetical protein SAMD00019534_028970 [Acytostelium subglobosum LB1]